MATLFNTKISNTYQGLLKTVDNAAISATLRELSDGSGNQTGLYLNTAGDFKVTSVLEWGSLKDTGTGVTITRYVTSTDGLENFDNNTSLPTSAAVKLYVDTKFATSDTLQEVLSFGNTTSGNDIVVSPNDDVLFSVGGNGNSSSKAIFGSGGNDQLQISQDGNQGYIYNSNTLNITGDRVFLKYTDATTFLLAENNSVQIRHNNQPAIQTTGTGVTITGIISGLTNPIDAQDAATKSYVDALDAGSDLDITDGTNTGAVNLNTQTLSVLGTTNEIEAVVSGQGVTIGLPSSISTDLVGNVTGNVTGNVAGDLTGNVTSTSVLANGVTATTQASTDSSTKVATTAYVKGLDNASDLDFSGDSGTGDVNLNAQTFAITGTANQIESSASNQGLSLQFPTAGVTLPNGSVATTQSADDNSTKVATTSYVDTSAALYLPLVGGTMSGNTIHNDSIKSIYGTGSDAQVYHDGSNFYANNSTGQLNIDQSAVTESIVFKTSDANALDTTALIINRGGDLITGRDVTIAGDLTVNGTTTTVNSQTLSVDDPLISLAINNAANSLDIGYYGKYNDGTTRYLGLFNDASDSNKFKLFKGTTVEPTTTVNIGAAGYAAADLELASLTALGSTSAPSMFLGGYTYHSGDANTYFGFPANDRFAVTAGGNTNLELVSNGVSLRHTGNTKLITTSTGVAVTGNVTVDTGSGIFTVKEKGSTSVTLASSASMTYFGSTHEFYNIDGTVESLRLNTDQSATFAGDVTAQGATFTDDVTIDNSSPELYLTPDASKYSWMIAAQENVDQHFEITPSTTVGGTTFSTPALKISGVNSNATFAGTTTAPTFKTSNLGIIINNQDIYSNEDYNGNDGSIRLNRLGYLGGQTKFRNTIIYNGKGTPILTAEGSSARVGIGTASPDANLHVGNVGAAAEFWLQRTDGYNAVKFYGSTLADGQGFKINVNGGDRFAIDSTGNVGIGTVSPTDLLSLRKDVAGGDVAIYLQNYNSVVGSTDETVSIKFAHGDDNGNGYVGAKIVGGKEGDFESSPANAKGFMSFYTNEGSLTSQVEQMRINGDGNVGIGTDSPAQVLHTNTSSNVVLLGESSSGSNTAYMYLKNATSTSTYTVGYGSTGDEAIITSGGAERMRITSAGNVIVKQGQLEIQSAGNVAETNIIKIGTHPSSGYGSQISASSFYNSVLSTDLRFSTTNTSGVLTERMRITSGGEVVLNQATSKITGGGDDTGRMILANSDTSAYITLYGSAYAATPNLAESIQVIQNSVVTATFSEDNRLGIGITEPAYKLHVHNPSNVFGQTGEIALGVKSNDNNDNPRVVFQALKSGTNMGSLAIQTLTSNVLTEKMRITSGGNVEFGTGAAFIPSSVDRNYLRLSSSTTASAGIAYFINPNGTVGQIATIGSSTSYLTTSDYRLKEDLQDFAGLDMVSKIPVYDFKWKTDESRSYGVMAHELQDVLPDAVSGEKDAKEMQGVDYSKIVPLLIKSIQELTAKVERLEAK